MKNYINLLLGLLAVVVMSCAKPADQEQAAFTTVSATDSNGYTYEYVVDDPLKARIYTLDNGLKVYLSQYQAKPRIQTYIAVKAGGKYDPADATGLAHYLEHMMFKGTSKFGTADWAKEKVLLDSIEAMFEHYRTLEDEAARKAYYAKIDEVSLEASKYAIANEYDKMLGALGASGTNAYTTEDRTVYVNDIPTNELDKWLDVESERFSMIVNRLFHTELEAVYEEKNRSLDNDGWQVYETLASTMFPDHKYGTQTVIGTIDHLKNPSITKIREYFAKYYIPNNVAICLSGDLNYDATIKKIDQYFGKWEQKPLEPYKMQESAPITSVQEKTVTGPEAANVTIGFKLPGQMSEERVLAKLCDMILSNSSAGLIDLNLKQSQKVLNPYSYINSGNDYSAQVLGGMPREGQTLAEVKDLLLAQVEKIKKGEFEDWLIEAIVNDFRKMSISQQESNSARAGMFVTAFTNDIPWADFIDDNTQMKAYTKQDVMDFANKYFKDNYVVVYKEVGEKSNKVKVEKPQITQVELNREKASEFLTRINETPAAPLQPVFLDFSKDLTITAIKQDIPLWYKVNDENELFNLTYQIDRGSNNDPMMSQAVNYLSYLGTEDLTAEEVKKEFYKLGCDYSVYAGDRKVYVSLSGLDDNFEPALDLFEKLLKNAKADDEALVKLVDGVMKQRDNQKKNKNALLFGGLRAYATYGPDSPNRHNLSNNQLKALDPAVLVDKVHHMLDKEHKVEYYGPRSVEDLTKVLNQYHQVPESLVALEEEKDFKVLPADQPTVFWVDYDMRQSEVIMIAPLDIYDPKEAAAVTLFNEYFGGGMSSIVFTTMRESKALAYSVWSAYSARNEEGKRDLMFAYIGTQADKLSDAMEGMTDLINNPPKVDKNFEAAKVAVLKSLESERIIKAGVLGAYESALRKGLDYDQRKEIYEAVKTMTLEDVIKFQEEKIKDKTYNIAVIGKKENLDPKVLSKYGKVKEVKLEEIFGFEEDLAL
ncbi:pitrilysin family protein [Persicobacter sp. CCB-QB2]|uniref:M16 family metallopeptidase n=1 Tax=Persicobacter sp. CCB-QB2 TaxID=1561025 RepID=UPI0006A9E004|nr:insulinase family protein [Persicobacter sp. CCB-QB2]